MTDTKVTTYIELKPEHYVGGMSLTIQCKPSEQIHAELLLAIIGGLEGWEIDHQSEPASSPTAELSGGAPKPPHSQGTIPAVRCGAWLADAIQITPALRRQNPGGGEREE